MNVRGLLEDKLNAYLLSRLSSIGLDAGNGTAKLFCKSGQPASIPFDHFLKCLFRIPIDSRLNTLVSPFNILYPLVSSVFLQKHSPISLKRHWKAYSSILLKKISLLKETFNTVLTANFLKYALKIDKTFFEQYSTLSKTEPLVLRHHSRIRKSPNWNLLWYWGSHKAF